MKSGQNVTEHVTKFFGIVDKLADMDIEINDDLLTIMLLQNLPDDFGNFRYATESRDDLPKPDTLRIK